MNEGLCHMQYSSTDCCLVTPLWLFVMPTIDLNIQQQIRDNSTDAGLLAQNYIWVS